VHKEYRGLVGWLKEVARCVTTRPAIPTPGWFGHRVTEVDSSGFAERSSPQTYRVTTYVYTFMSCTWDPAKSRANLLERGFDFAFAELVFEGPTHQENHLGPQEQST